ncbi:hypothetical protein GHT06_011513 [Daphnia sinensis]|uniref:Uncharacterized protein n=1 Tax=Daphnia sinensis TaxID=1820382 RepID=A0AAD5PUM5_9CRUS|nr:hypothetical protein GHT06_011513 [Daphnia sinensis]
MVRIGSWIRNFGIMSGVGVSIALAFRFCGLGSLLGLYIPCCRYFNPCSWLTPPQTARRDIELGAQATTNLAPTAPVTIVNIPPPPQPAGFTGRPGLNPQPYLNQPTSYPRSLTQHREAAALLSRP